MNHKVVFLDIDGTLVGFDGTMPESAKEALHKAKANGHKMVICTGRSYFQLGQELLDFGFDGIVCAAGVCVIADGEEIFHAYIPQEEVKNSYDYLESNGFLFCYQATEGLVQNQRCQIGMEERFRKQGVPEKVMQQIAGNVIVREDVWNHPHLEKIIYNDAPFPVEEVHEQMLPYFDAVALSFDETEGYSGEIGINGIHKATGMQCYLEHVGITREDSIGIGDGPNDLQMMEYAGTSVAMGNARQEVKDLADMVTDDIDKDGIYKAFEQLGLI